MDPAETQMRKQMYNTMVALEKMATMVTGHLTGLSPLRQDEGGKYHFDGDLVVDGDLTVMGTTTAVSSETIPGPAAPLSDDLGAIRKELDAHRKALAIIGTFGVFKDIFFGTKPDRAVHHLVRLKSCSCVGTGWVARDEQCAACKTSGYLEA